jgi:4-amino-4-deoxy-L-arabinose transferase-like glycosyltransferase
VSPHRGFARETTEPRKRVVAAAPPWWLVGAAVLVVLPFLGKAPAIDEEGYLWIARNLDVLRPYDWARVWAPYTPDSYGWAHPPLHLLWLKLCTSLTDTSWLLRALAGLPWVALLAASVALLAARTCQHPGLAAALWLTSPIVVLGLHDTWMIDLPAVALATAAVAAYREGLVDEDGRWFIASGILLGLAIETKYTMGVLVPVLAVHMLRLGPRPGLWAAAAAVVLVVEAPLWFLYGRVHPWEVFVRREEIEAGGLAGRVLGTLARAALLGLPLVLVRTAPALVGGGFAVGLVAVLAARPREMAVTTSTLLVLLAGLGAALISRAVAAAVANPHRRRKGDRGDPLLLGGWVAAVVLGVIVLHNYASARYLLPAAAPAALLLARSGEEARWGKALVRASAGIMAVLAAILAVADYRFAAAGDEVAHGAVAAVAEAGGAPGRFAGEWSFRGAMESAGWTRYRPDEALPAGTWVVVADNASAGTVATDVLEPVRRVASEDTFPVRVVDLAGNVGLYAETLGMLPFGVRRGPLESATLYRVRGTPEAP